MSNQAIQMTDDERKNKEEKINAQAQNYIDNPLRFGERCLVIFIFWHARLCPITHGHFRIGVMHQESTH